RGQNGSAPESVRDEVLGGRKSLGDAVDEFERDLIEEALRQTEFNQTRAAERLGTTRRILKYRMDKLGIDAPDRNGAVRTGGSGRKGRRAHGGLGWERRAPPAP